MKPTDFWKTFKLAEELSISGTFIYNGLRRYHEMEKLDFSDEVFEFLYNLSVGLERLFKIAVVLFEHDNSINQDALEKSLITHNHLELLKRLKNHVEINFGKPQIGLLNLLSLFYKSYRYDRFSLTSAYHSKREIDAILTFLKKHLQVDIPNNLPFFGTQNKKRYRRFIQRTVMKISNTVYKIIEDRSHAIGLFTYELRSGSKAESVFLREVDISNEDVLWKELLIFLMNTNATSNYLKFLRNIPPLDFDEGLISDYLDCFQSDAAKARVMGELEWLYEELEGNKKQRIDLISFVGSPNVSFGEDDDEVEEDDL